jgi:hypothetical protein
MDCRDYSLGLEQLGKEPSQQDLERPLVPSISEFDFYFSYTSSRNSPERLFSGI